MPNAGAKPRKHSRQSHEELEPIDNIHTKLLAFHKALNKETRQRNQLEDRVEILEPLIRQMKALEDRIHELERKGSSDAARPSKADLIYKKHKAMLEAEHMDEVVAFDIDTEQIVGYGNTVREAFDDAKKNTNKEQFYLKRVGSKYMHRL